MAGKISPLAGKPVTQAMLVDVDRLTAAYYSGEPDPAIVAQRVAFGTSGHRGSAFDNTFNEAHILAISQAICLYRKRKGIEGPLFIGIDTHALSQPALASALEVFAANGVDSMIDEHDGYTPTRSNRLTPIGETISTPMSAIWPASSIWRQSAAPV